MKEKEPNIDERQLKMLQNIFQTCMPPRPAFKSNHEGVPDGFVPYICTSDVFEYRYNIRILPIDDFLSKEYKKKENGEIIAHYDSMEDLVADGWKLD